MRHGLQNGVQKNRAGDSAIVTRTRLPRLRLILLSLTLSLASLSAIPGQELDTTRRGLSGIRKNLVWENLTLSRQYLRGARPKRHLPTAPATITLAPGEGTEFLVPGQEMIRVVSVDGERIDDGLTQIWTSNGSGIYRKQISAIADNGCSILAAPNETGYSIAKVCRSPSSRGSIRLAIYTSARPPNQTLDYYNCPISTAGRVSISDDRGSKPREYARMTGGQRVGFALPGASRLRIEARLRYDLQPERRQTFWIRAYVDGHLYRVLSMDTEPTSKRRQFVQGQERLIGRREFAYLDLDCGDKRVEIEASHDCYLRIDGVGLDLCRPNLNRSFDYPDWENLKKAVTIWDSLDFDPQELIDDEIPIELANRYGVHPDLINVTGDPLWDPYLNQQRMQAVARDNSIPHGGLRAYMWLLACVSRHNSGAGYGDEVDLDDLCQRIRNRYTMFRDTPIIQLPAKSDLRRAAYVRRQVRRPGEDRTERIIGAQHLQSSLSLIGQAGLVDLTDDCTKSLECRFPVGLGTSMVRLIVDQTNLSGDIRLMVRYDDRSPMEFLVSPDACIERRSLVPTTAEAALSAMSGTYGQFDQLTAGGPFAMYRENVPIVRAATAEIIKPADVHSVEVWIEPCDGECVNVPIGIGVQHLDGRTSELSETSYRFLQGVVEVRGKDELSAAFARRELDNDAFQLETELREHHAGILASVRRHPHVETPTDLWDEATLQSQQTLIDELRTRENWPAAIELLSDLIEHTKGETRRKAILARVDLLQLAGENYLAEIELRGWMIYSKNRTFRREVFDRLMTGAADDRYQRIRYLAFAAIEWNDPSVELRLATELADGSRYRDALILLSTLASRPDTETLLLRCSMLAGWWTTFDWTLDRVREPSKKNLWMGLKQWRLGFDQHAKRALSAGQNAGRDWLAYAKSAEQIFDDLMHSDTTARLEAIGRWEQWQTQHPGKMRWRNLPGAVRRAAGTVQTVSLPRGTRSSYHIATPSRPAEIEVQGPVRIKISTRPIHPRSESEDNVNDWLHLESGQASTLVPVTSNSISKTLRMECRAERIGQLLESVVDLPAGRNRFRVYCAHHRCLVQIAVERPEIALPILPPVNSTAMAMVVQGHFGNVTHVCQTSATGNTCRDCVRLFRRDHKCATIPIQYVAAPCRCTNLDAAEQRINSLPFGDVAQWHGRVTPVDPELVIEGRNSTVDSAIAIAHQSEIDAISVESDPLSTDADPRLAGLIRLNELAQNSSENIRTLENRLRQGSTWELFRQFDERAGVHSVALERWSPESPHVRIRKQLMPEVSSRFSLENRTKLQLEIADDKPTTFEFEFTQPSVGFVPLPSASTIIETRSRSRIVTCKVPDVPVSSRIEIPAGRSSIALSLSDRIANQYVLADVFEIDSQGNRLPIDHGHSRRVVDKRNYQVATAKEPLVIRVAGPEILRVDRYLNGVTTSEYVSTLNDQILEYAPPAGDDPALYRVFRLVYPERLESPPDHERLPDSIDAVPIDHVLIKPVPIRLSLSNDPSLGGLPTRDEVDEQTLSVSDDAVLVAPTYDSAGTASVNGLDAERIEGDWIGGIVQAAYHQIDHPESIRAVDSLALRSGDLIPLTVRFDEWAEPQDRLPGTTGLGVRFKSRYVDEEFPQPRNNDEFMEFKASRLMHHRWNDHYTETDLLARTRENSSSTIGLDHRGTKDFSIDYCDPLAHSDRWTPLRLNYRGYILGQFDVNRRPGASASPDVWTTGFRAGISRRHYFNSTWSERWSASMFARSVRESVSGYEPGSIDQDIFTRYKSDHPFGLRLSHRLLYQNNLDSRWWLSPTLVTNSDQWVPDNLGLHVGTDQLIGPLQIRLSYRMTGYLADNDRKESRLQNVIYADVLLAHENQRESWSEWSLSVRSNLTNDNTTVGVNWVVYLNDGRGFRDFRPGSLLFRDLRDERATRRYLFEP